MNGGELSLIAQNCPIYLRIILSLLVKLWSCQSMFTGRGRNFSLICETEFSDWDTEILSVLPTKT